MSDLHLEINGNRVLPEKFEDADMLIVAGDLIAVNSLRENRTDVISRTIKKAFQQFKRLITNYHKVIIVAGNHEHYHNNFNNTISNLKTAFADCPNVEVLSNSMTSVGETLFFGATFWTNFGNHNPVSMNAIHYGMNDYHLIYANDNKYPIEPEFTYNQHLETMRILRTTCEHNKDQPIVIVGHHAPSAQSLNLEHSGNSLDDGYYSDLSEFILDNPNIKLWFHGHCHMNTDYKIGKTRILSNQAGYHMEQSFAKFRRNPNAIVEI